LEKCKLSKYNCYLQLHVYIYVHVVGLYTQLSFNVLKQRTCYVVADHFSGPV